MSNIEFKDRIGTKDIQLKTRSSSIKRMPLALKIIQYLSLAVFIGFAIITRTEVIPNNPKLIIIDAISLGTFVFLFFLDIQMSQNAREMTYEDKMLQKAELYLINSNQQIINNPIVPVRQKALQYAEDLIKDYKSTRRISRNLYYGLQIGTIILSGVTPILVLVDKIQASDTWLKWLPVIFPAVASIVASIVTSFPFQENWISANKTVELLEAEQEKFILGITSLYRCYDTINEKEQEKKAKKSIENFITQVNNIHLKQVQQTSSISNDEEKTEQSSKEKIAVAPLGNTEESSLPISV